MTTDVQALLLRIDASTELARREIQKLDGPLNNLGDKAEQGAKRFETSMAKIGSAVKAAGIAFVLNEAVNAGRAILNFADDLATAADQANISVERFQTLREALRSLEVPAEQQEKLFQRLLTTLGEVQGGTAAKGVVEVLDRMGITARIANGEISTTDGLLDAIAGAATRYSTQAQFAADVTELVGKRVGPQLAAALKDGGVALKDLENGFRDTGAVIDEEMIKKLADANEAIDSFTERSRNRLVIWAANTIGSFEAVSDAIRGWQLIYDQAGLQAALFTREDQATARGRQNREVMSLIMTPNTGQNGLPGFAPVSRGGPPPSARGAGGGGRTARPQSRATPAPGLAPLALENALQTARRVADTLPVQSAKDFLESATLQVPELLLNFEELARTVEGISTIQVIDGDDIRFAEEFASTLNQGLANAIATGQSFGSVIEQLGRQLLASGILNLLSGGREGTSFGTIFGSVKSLLGFATGGRPPMGQASIVGERGPELFVPSVPGEIIPNYKLAGAMGGGGGMQQVQVSVAPSPLFITTVAQGAQASANEAIRQRTRQRMPSSPGS